MSLQEDLHRSLGERAFTSGAALDEVSRDFGGLVEHRPLAMVRPVSERDVEETVRLARRHAAGVVARGCGHSTQGQSQADRGIVLGLRSWRGIATPSASHLTVEAGALWEEVLFRTLPCGLTPPVLTDYLGLTVGGTLSAGGVGLQSFHAGSQTDHVTALRVVTGSGETLDCSREHNADLFHACCAGLGQCGIIVRATVRLVPAPTSVQVQRFVYSNPEEMLVALHSFAGDRSYHGLQASIAENDPRRIAELFGAHANEVETMGIPGRWLYLIAAVKYKGAFWQQTTPRSEEASTWPGRPLPVQTMSYFQFVSRCRYILEAKPEKFGGVHDCPHPWINLVLPADECQKFVGEILSDITEDNSGRGPMLFLPLRRDRMGTPLLRIPTSEYSVKVSLLRNLPNATPEKARAALALNGQLYDKCLARGGTRYPIDSVPMKDTDWARHFGEQWATLQRMKHRYDPDNILGGGENIFPRRRIADDQSARATPDRHDHPVYPHADVAKSTD